MKTILKTQVVGVAVELSEAELHAADYWFANRNLKLGEIKDPEKCEFGYQIMIGMLKLFREGFHKDGDKQ